MDDIRKDPEHKNYISVYRGLAFVGEKLESYTLGRLDKIYQRIYAKEAGKPQCTSECSKTYKDQTTKWCATCRGWKFLLLKTHQSTKVNLGKVQSWFWPLSSHNIAEFYIPPWGQTQHVNLLDISISCCIWENCTEFSVKNAVIKRVRDCRNKFFAHNPSSKVTDLEKAKTFDALKDLLNDQDVQGFINSQECIRQLKEIEHGYKLELWESALLENKILLSQLQDGQLEILKRLQNTTGKKDKMISLNRVFLPVQNVFRAITKIRRVPGVFLFMFAIVVFFGLFYQKGKHLPNTGCISEMYTFPFKQDLPLMSYLSEHRNFVGRDWLMQKIEEDIITSNTTENRGLVLVAEMGYGKSALISNLLCSRNVEKANTINSHIVAFHVCKFNVKSTKFPERFIRRLVGFLAMKSAEYGNIISTLPEESILYDRDSCSKEPDACFDQGITIPLKQIHDVSGKPWIITVDALDECEEEDNNWLLDLISSRITLLPKWLKFLITSRNSVLLTKLAKLKVEYLAVNDSRNIEDIKSFILQSFNNPDLEFINNLVSKSDGSFIYVLQTLNWLSAEKDGDVHFLPNFPNDLSEVYEINFDRQFKNTDSYRIPKMILEIICSTTNPLSKHEMFRILEVNNILDNYSKFENKLKLLQYFLRINKEVSLFHQALYYWLISNSNKIYRISLFEGHALISNFLFSSLNKSEATNLVDLAIHVANSDNSTLTKTFISLRMIEDISYQSLLHKLIWKTSSSVALDLLTYHISDVNAVNKGNVTPAFVAAAKGHTDQLRLLHKKGANIDFKVRSNFILGFGNSFDPFIIYDKLEQIKRLYYSGYSCLHIAAQHGHTDIVKYILKHEQQLLNYKNALGLEAGLTACENGHMDVIKEMYKINPKLFGYKCLYYASSKNHKLVVEWLFQIGVNFKCISKKHSTDALNEIIPVRVTESTAISKAVFPNDTSEHENVHVVYPIDKWWIYFRHDPLLAAIISGSIDTAKYLIEVFPDSLKCSDSFGYTASLLSVKFNRTELFPFLKSYLSSDKCTKALEVLNDHLCPEGATFVHIAALHISNDVLIHAYNYNLYIPWNEPDSLGNLPIHYAVVNENGLFILYYKIFSNIQLSDVRSSNGSTPYHDALLSRNPYFIFYIMTNALKQTVPDLKDRANRSVLHYLVLRDFSASIGESEECIQQSFLNIFQFLIETCKHDLMAIDSSGNNVLHYALRYGHPKIILMLNSKYHSSVRLLLKQKNVNALDPVHFALSNNFRISAQTTPPNGSCQFYDVFYEHCKTKLSTVMSSWELSLVYLIQSFSPDSNYLRRIMDSNLVYVFHKSAYITLAYFVYFKDICIRTVRHHLINTSYIPDNSVKSVSLLAIAKHKPSVFQACNGKFNQSILHILMLRDKELHFLFQSSKCTILFFLRSIFGNPFNMTIFCCSDNRGYNIFHYAVISGQIQTARFLMREGISVINEHLGLTDVIKMALTSGNKIKEIKGIDAFKDIWYKNQLTDKFLTALLKRYKTMLSKSDLCYSNSSNLSLVHLLAANDMINTLKTAVQAFGQDLMFCKSRDNFTPLYLAKFFNSIDVVKFIKTFSKLEYPGLSAEKVLILFVLNEFPHFIKWNQLFNAPVSLTVNVIFRRLLKQCNEKHDWFGTSDFNIIFKIVAKYLVWFISLIKGEVVLLQRVFENTSEQTTICFSCKDAVIFYKQKYTLYNSIKIYVDTLVSGLRKQGLGIMECQKCNRTVTNMKYFFIEEEAILRHRCLLPCIDTRQLHRRAHSLFQNIFISFYRCTQALIIHDYVTILNSSIQHVPESYTFFRKRITTGFHDGEFSMQSSFILITELLNKYKSFYEIKQLHTYKKFKAMSFGYPNVGLYEWNLNHIKSYEKTWENIHFQSFVLESPFNDLK